jgi:hypothetical protein
MERGVMVLAKRAFGCGSGTGAGRRRRVGELLAVVWMVSLADLVLTLWAQAFTPFEELNPIARAMLGAGATGMLIVYKLSLTATGSGLFWRVRGDRRAEWALWAIVIIYVLLAVQWSNYTNAAVLMPGAE